MLCGRKARFMILLSLLQLINLIEDAAVIEMRLLDLAPATENFVHGEEFNLSEIFSVLLGDLDQTRAIKILGRDLLTFWRVEIFQIRLRHRACSVLINDFVDHRDRRLGNNAD